jgi:predicted O-linked N-acetylglucosamine transferase (SPINDLY family)
MSSETDSGPADRAPDGVRESLAAALAAQRAGDPVRAASLAEAVLARFPDRADALQILAVALAQQGMSGEAIRTFERAIALAPDDAGLRFNCGTLLGRLGDADGAERQFRAAIAAAPDHVEALYNLGHLLQERGDLAQADNLLRRALAVRPLYARGWSGLATVLRAQGRLDEAGASCRRAIAINPDQTVARITLANICRDSGRAGEALAQLRAALAAEPDNGPALAFLVHQLQQCCDWRELPELGARLDAANEAAIAAGRQPPEPAFAQLARIDDPARNLALARAHARGFGRIAPLSAARRPAADAPVRVAYLSNDLQDHPVGQLVAGLVARHDRSRFHVSAYSWGADDGSATRRQLVAGVDNFVDIAGLDRAAAAARIRADGVEILIDLKGQTQGHRLDIMAMRPAPVQATFLGFPGSSGTDFVDYILADRIVLPPAEARYFSEQPVWLPHCYMPPGEDPPPAEAGSRADRGLPERAPVLASFNNGYKIEPLLFDAWMRILARVPGAVLWLHRYNELVADNLRREAQARGIDPARLVFADRPSRPLHLARLAHADLALDTRLFNGHATTLDALRAGVPVIATAGRHFASRVAASLLSAARLPELVARDLDEYGARVLALLGDPASLRETRARLAAARRSAPLFDAASYARGFDRALLAMAARHRAGRQPAPIEVPGD